MEKEYYIKMNNENYGPYSFTQVCSLGVFDTTFVSVPQDNAGWRMAKDVPELQGFTITEETTSLQAPESSQFFVREGASIYGPYTIEELACMEVKEGSFVGINSSSKWYLAELVDGLLPLLEQYKARIVEQHQQQQNEAAQRREQLRDRSTPGTPISPYADDELYYVSLDNENYGPFDLQSLRGFGLFDSSMVRKYNEDIWRLANTLPELNGYTVSEEIQPVEAPPTSPVNEPYHNTALYDMAEDFNSIYDNYRNEILQKLFFYKNEYLQKEEANVPNRYSEEMFEMSWSRYQRGFDVLIKTLGDVRLKCDAFEKKYQEDAQGLNNLYLQKTLVAPMLHQAPDIQEMTQIDGRRRQVSEKYEKIRSELLLEIKLIIESFNRKNPPVFNERYELASSTENCWQILERMDSDSQKRYYVGDSKFDFAFFNTIVKIDRREYLPFLNAHHYVFRYAGKDRQKCLNATNTLISRSLMAVPSGGLRLTMIDANGMNGTNDEFKSLSRNVFRISSRSVDIMKVLDETVLHIENVIQHMLAGQSSLADFNNNKENKEQYRILVIEDFPIGIPMEGINQLKKILKNGIRAGVVAVLLVNEDEINRSEDALKAFRLLDLEQFLVNTSLFDFVNNVLPQENREFNPELHFDVFSNALIKRIVASVNKGFEVQTETVLHLEDYLPDRKEWWTGTSASLVEIPFGMSNTKAIAQLRITQESGQNSAVVIGIPGSGKSVFLHSIIVDAAVKYSPDELQMYLLDFSGVEFNTYANHKLPHARVIAPEAEREFGLSVLRELKEEGARRMTLCRDNDVTSIVEYRKRNPNAVMPRLLVIIDEFQKIFEVENDAISKEANSIIHIIIQEYRKFGINLILATQRIPSSSVLPRDLIANRVVFKSAPNDFSALISWQNGITMPALHTGQCIYNAESGASYANEQTQGFFIPLRNIEKLVDELNEKARSEGRDNKDLIVFRGNDLPDFKNRRLPHKYMVVQDIPEEVPICLGQSIAISDTDVCAVLRKESTNNLLIIGGEKDVAQNMMLHAALSTTLSHTSDSASFYLFNFMRPTDVQYNLPAENFEGMPFPVRLIEKMTEVKDVLTEVKNEIDARKQDETKALTHIYINFFAFQLGRVFDRGGRRGDDVSEEGQLLDYILRQGPAYGVFTLLQVDKMDGLARIGTPITCFTHRAVMQISENESIKLMDSPLANRLFIMSRPSSKFRAFYRDQNKNVTIKFKPYK